MVVEGASHRLDAALAQRRGRILRAGKAEDVMALLEQPRRHRPADVAGGTSD